MTIKLDIQMKIITVNSGTNFTEDSNGRQPCVSLFEALPKTSPVTEALSQNMILILISYVIV